MIPRENACLCSLGMRLRDKIGVYSCFAGGELDILDQHIRYTCWHSPMAVDTSCQDKMM